MTSIVAFILQLTVGFLVNKGRDLAAKKLEHGDVTDQRFRKLILREPENLKIEINGLARKDLVSSSTFFKEGISLLYQVFEKQEAGEDAIETTRAGVGMKCDTFSSANDASKLLALVDKQKMLNINDLSETAKRIFSNAQENFQQARKRAIDAFTNEALKTTDRLLAMKIRILATIIENINFPVIALRSCKLCLEELHKMPVVQNCFFVEMTKSVRSWFNKNERWEIIAHVYQMNYVVHRVTRIVKGDLNDQLPFIEIKNLEQINPLRDCRVIRALKEFKLEHCMLEWTFGKEEESSKLLHPTSITTNTQGQFIVADYENVKVFDPLGKFLYALWPERQKSKTCILATDRNDNLYLCIDGKTGTPKICVFDRNHNPHHSFPLRAARVNEARVNEAESLTISNDDQVFVVVRYGNGIHQVHVYENDGSFLYSFGDDVLSKSWTPLAITTSGDDVMILEKESNCVQVFSAKGDHLYKFEVKEVPDCCGGIAFFEPSQHVLILSLNDDNKNRVQWSIYTKDGEFVRSVQVDTPKWPWFRGIAVTMEGQAAVTNYVENKIHVLHL